MSNSLSSIAEVQSYFSKHTAVKVITEVVNNSVALYGMISPFLFLLRECGFVYFNEDKVWTKTSDDRTGSVDPARKKQNFPRQSDHAIRLCKLLEFFT